MKVINFRVMTSVFGLAAGAFCLTPSMAFAQDSAEQASQNDEIVVTAQRREEAARDVPITITSLNTQQLETANVNALSDTAKLTPGLRFDTQGPAMQPTIRGVGTAVTTSGGGPNVAIYVDGFFQANTYASNFQLTKVKDIQVLKGPQGTLFGRNTTGGAILVTTADPSTKTSVELKAGWARFNALNLQGYATAGLSENIAADIEVMYRSGDGHFTDVLTNNKKIGKYENWSIRAGLKVDISPDVSLLLRYAHESVNDPSTQLVNAFVDKTGEAGFLSQVSAAGKTAYGKTSSAGLPLVYFYSPSTTYASKPGDVALNGPLSFKNESDTYQARLKADLGFADLASYTQLRKDHSPYYGDLDAIAIPMFNILVDVHDKTFSQELVLNSKPGGALQWTAGVNYFQYRDTWDVGANFGGAGFGPYGGSSTNTKSYAAFLDLTYGLSDKLFLTLGGRYSHDLVADSYFVTNPFTFSYTGPSGLPVAFSGAPGTKIPVATLTNNSFTPRVVLRYKPSDDSSIYASFTRGYKAGILNVGGLSQQPVKPETINAFELGYKFDDRVLSASLAGFYYDYKNLQVSSFQSGAAQIRNAASSEIYGLEAQLSYKVSDALSINGGAAWTHARYKSFTNAPYYSYCDPAAGATSPLYCLPIAFGGSGPGGLVQTYIDASGYKMQRSPEFTANLGMSYGADVAGGKLVLSGNLYYTSSFYFDPEQQFRQDGYALVSARAQWTDPSEHFTLAVYGDNLTNKRYQSQVLFNTLGIGSVWSPPTTYGVSVGFKY